MPETIMMQKETANERNIFFWTPSGADMPRYRDNGRQIRIRNMEEKKVVNGKAS